MPKLPLRLMTRFRAWYGATLINRVALFSQAAMLGVLFVIGLAILPLVTDLLNKSLADRLDAYTSSGVQRLESELDRLLLETEKMANRTLVANGLLDSEGSQGYLRPFLAEYQRDFPEIVSLGLFDSLGRSVASAGSASRIKGEVLDGVLRSERSAFALDVGTTNLGVAFPVRFLGTGRAEGVLAAEIDLRHLVERVLGRVTAPDGLPLVATVSIGDKVLYRAGKIPDADAMPVSRSVGGVMASHNLPLTLSVSIPRAALYAPLARIYLSALLISVAAIILVMILAKRVAKNVIGPLSDMSHRAMEIAGAGPSGLRELPVTRIDEIGWMGTAFNEMVASLRQAYAHQEQLVQDRTRELAVAQERLATVLANIDDVVYALKPGSFQVEYVSPAVESVFGYSVEGFVTEPGLLERLVLPDDLPQLRMARNWLMECGETELRYRIRRADGAVRWVLDRFHVVFDSNQRLTAIAGVIQDITDTVQAEESLRLRERALASASCGVVITDMRVPGEPILYVNDAFERITGYSSSEVLGRNCAFLQGTHERDEQALKEIRSAIASGRGCKVVLRNYRKNGAPFWNELQLSPLRDDQGRVTHYIGIQNDISASIAATQALVDSEKRLALTIDALHEGVWDWNIAEDRLITSPSWARVMGRNPDQLGSQQSLATFSGCLAPEWSERLVSAIQWHIDNDTEDFYLEHPVIRHDGSSVWVASHGRVVEREVDGSARRMVGSVVDISDRVEATRRIINLMAQLDVILTLTPDAIVYLDEKSEVAFVNRAFELMTGVKAGEVTGMKGAQFVDMLRERADSAAEFPSLIETTAGKVSVPRLLYMQKPQRRVLQVSWQSPADGKSVVVYLRDVTRETEVDRMKSEFLSTAAHELRTPMASIMGFAELLMMREFPPERTRDMLGTMHRQARRLTNLINELLDLARIEARAGKDFKRVPSPVVPVVRDAVAALQVDVDGSRMKLDLCDNLPEVNIDSAKLQQAVLNVISNAYKYSPDGGDINISVGQESCSDGLRIAISVRDHGIGMTPEQLARVFERFFRADPSGNIPGTGLGMSLVKEIMETHDGGVEIDSAPGEGTTVTLWLPLLGAGKVEDAEPEESQAQPGDLTLWLNDDPVREGRARVLH